MPMSPRLLRPRATGFNPKSIGGLALWVDFADQAPGNVTLDGSNKISGVLDKSGNGYHGTQTTAGDRLGISTLNGLRCADNGTASNTLCVRYTHGSNANNWRHTFVVARWDAAGSSFPAFSCIISGAAGTGTNSGLMLIGYQGFSRWYTDDQGVMVGTGRKWRTNGGTFYTSPGATADEAFAFFGNTFIFAGDAQANVTLNGWQIGNDRGNARGWRGRIGEVLSYSVSLTLTQQQAVESYLGKKWGVTLG